MKPTNPNAHMNLPDSPDMTPLERHSWETLLGETIGRHSWHDTLGKTLLGCTLARDYWETLLAWHSLGDTLGMALLERSSWEDTPGKTLLGRHSWETLLGRHSWKDTLGKTLLGDTLGMTLLTWHSWKDTPGRHSWETLLAWHSWKDPLGKTLLGIHSCPPKTWHSWETLVAWHSWKDPLRKTLLTWHSWEDTPGRHSCGTLLTWHFHFHHLSKNATLSSKFARFLTTWCSSDNAIRRKLTSPSTRPKCCACQESLQRIFCEPFKSIAPVTQNDVRHVLQTRYNVTKSHVCHAKHNFHIMCNGQKRQVSQLSLLARRHHHTTIASRLDMSKAQNEHFVWDFLHFSHFVPEKSTFSYEFSYEAQNLPRQNRCFVRGFRQFSSLVQKCHTF